ncbi:MAG: DMT family transporter [Sedimentisphaerales bacterium]|nr:DMT family transporter [Sedimentisphaerales bacterium]
MSNKTTGIAAILGASVMWAIEPNLAKLAYETSGPLQTSAFRAIGVTVTALVYTLLTNRGNLKVTRKQLSVLCYIAIVGTLVADLLYFFALKSVPVVNAVVIGHMQPIWVVLIAYFVLKEDKLTKYDYLGILVMLVAGTLVATRTAENLRSLKLGTTGDLLVLAATVAWATTGIAMRKYLRRLNAGVITFYRFAIASIVFVTYLSLASKIVLAGIYQVLVGLTVGVGTILYYEGLKRIKAAQVSALELSTPLFAAALSFLIIKETVTMMQIFGIAMLIAGVILLSRKEETYF